MNAIALGAGSGVVERRSSRRLAGGGGQRGGRAPVEPPARGRRRSQMEVEGPATRFHATVAPFRAWRGSRFHVGRAARVFATRLAGLAPSHDFARVGGPATG